jgi:aryl-alcohol dehydrogenase-like predicted oxidoreductase
MEHHQLGRTGVSVSKLCLGTMMFGDWGNKDHEDSIRINPADGGWASPTLQATARRR